MYKLTLSAIVLSTILILSACKDDSSTTPSLSEDQSTVLQKTSNMTKSNGQVSVVSTNRINNGAHWEVKVDMPGDGGLVKFEYFVSNNELKEIKGLTPSFDYEVEPGNNLINYSAAKQISLGAVSGSIIEWKLEFDLSDNMWQYRFQIISGGNDWEVRLNAANGNVVRIKN
ncbi:PepSY domain-containing protein [Ignavibacterium sp.]|uniref:PepSY domain-containing protein n=1 Tax=Ignavibacterium sp. TaxID=2651167 RepID=UPI00307CD6E1